MVQSMPIKCENIAQFILKNTMTRLISHYYFYKINLYKFLQLEEVQRILK